MFILEYCNHCFHEKCRKDQRRYRSHHLIPMFIGTPCREKYICVSIIYNSLHRKYSIKMSCNNILFVYFITYVFNACSLRSFKFFPEKKLWFFSWFELSIFYINYRLPIKYVTIIKTIEICTFYMLNAYTNVTW